MYWKCCNTLTKPLRVRHYYVDVVHLVVGFVVVIFLVVFNFKPVGSPIGVISHMFEGLHYISPILL